MLVLIIHLARATHRLAHVQDLKARLHAVNAQVQGLEPHAPDLELPGLELPGLELEVRIQDAVDGSALPAHTWQAHVGASLIRPFYPFPLNPGEVGCFLSHREAWQAFLNSAHETCLILEDDADVDTDAFAQTIQMVTQRHCAYTQLPPRKPRSWPSDRALSQSSLTALSPPNLGTTGQILTRQAAEQLLAATQRFDRPIDTYLQMTWHHGVQIHTLYPCMVQLADGPVTQTTIQRKKNRSVLTELSRSWRRTLYRQKIQRLALSQKRKPQSHI